ncbi:MAG: DUF2147 domain-containing protein [Proteobacteria bacterium]|nr:DUF2147 domain-containing protein [Pseudomonadota bacterium]
MQVYKTLNTYLLTIVLMSYFNIGVAQEDGVVGLWLTDDGETVVNILQCNHLCGRIEGFNYKENSKTGSQNTESIDLPLIEKVCSTNIMGGFSKKSDKYKNGWIKDFITNEVYSTNLELIDKNTLKVTAYIGSTMFSESMLWHRTPKIEFSCDAILNTKPAVLAW